MFSYEPGQVHISDGVQADGSHHLENQATKYKSKNSVIYARKAGSLYITRKYSVKSNFLRVPIHTGIVKMEVFLPEGYQFSFHFLIVCFCFLVMFLPEQSSFRLLSENNVFGISISNSPFLNREIIYTDVNKIVSKTQDLQAIF